VLNSITKMLAGNMTLINWLFIGLTIVFSTELCEIDAVGVSVSSTVELLQELAGER